MEFDGTFIFVLVSFVIFMLLMRQMYFEPVRQIKEEREQKKADDLKNAEDHLADAQRLQDEYDQGIADARKQSHQVVQDIRQKAKESAAKSITKARTKAQQELDAEMEELAAWREETYKKLDKERRSLASTIVQKVAGKVPVASKS